mmetsp:Transcript_7288/g.20539  ORF Transcript_7288/g.20539 Transcript_7288/m.20539 type:complete len:268 (+) Transcript_7288:605-1408(+)
MLAWLLSSSLGYVVKPAAFLFTAGAGYHGLWRAFNRFVARQLRRPSGAIGTATAAFYSLYYGAGSAELLASLLSLPPGAVVLDACAGPGTCVGALLKRLAALARHDKSSAPRPSLLLLDWSETILETCKEDSCKDIPAGVDVSFHCANATSTPFSAQSVDAAILYQAVEYFPESGALPQLLAEMFRVLRPGGTLAIGLASPMALLELQHFQAGVIQGVNRAIGSNEVAEAAEKVGFECPEVHLAEPDSDADPPIPLPCTMLLLVKPT